MLNRLETRLEIIDDFRIDRELPKYRKKRKQLGNSKGVYLEADEIAESISFGEFESTSGRFVVTTKLIEKSWWSKFVALFKRKKPKSTMSILEFFTQVKTHTQKIEIVEERSKGYEIALQNAEKSGQVALKEKLKDGLQAYKAETLMLSIGIDKFVTENTVIEFYKQCKKGLRLDFVKNFVRTIPDEIIALKEKADELEIFDNYAVLHYDPDAKSYSETKAEKAAKKDPILFGLLKGRTDLYVLGDWVDEVCDLTLDQMAEVLGRDATKKISTSIS